MIAGGFPTRWRWIATLLALAATAAPRAASAQGSPYIALDDPRLPMLELLIARGDVTDPTPQVRPLLQRSVVAALHASAARDSTGASARLIRELLAAWELPATDGWWRVAPRGGVQAYTQGRRDLLAPGGPGGVQAYADAAFTMGLGALTVSMRPAYEPSLRDDPDYHPYGPVSNLSYYRFVEAYATLEWKWGGAYLGQMSRNWGPVGLLGIPISDYAYPRTELSFWFGNRTVRFEALVAPLSDGVTDSGAVVSRWFAAHRLQVRARDNLDLAVWESTVSARSGGALDPTILNPFILTTFGRQFGIGDRRNVMIGGDATWRPARQLRLEVQGAIDDWTFDPTNPYPHRFGLGVVASGALADNLGWHASYAMNSSLAYHTFDPNENFTDAGVGIGQNFIDNDQFSFGVSVPVRNHWLLTPQLDLRRQGEGAIDDPFPDAATAAMTPTLFIGTRRDTWQFTMGMSGAERGVAVNGQAGLQHVGNSGVTEFVGRVQVTVGFRVGGALSQ
jgi:hypothetical protein